MTRSRSPPGPVEPEPGSDDASTTADTSGTDIAASHRRGEPRARPAARRGDDPRARRRPGGRRGQRWQKQDPEHGQLAQRPGDSGGGNQPASDE